MLIVGLGNPGAEYQETRHNVGFMAVELLAHRLNFSWKPTSKFKADIAIGTFQDKKIILVKPQTYMNLSGIAVGLVKSFYNIPIEDILVIHDELDVKLGAMKYKQGGGAAGHNGIKSLDQNIGNNFHRLRVGIGRPEFEGQVSSYVLSKFEKNEQPIIENVLARIENSYMELLDKKFADIVRSIETK